MDLSEDGDSFNPSFWIHSGKRWDNLPLNVINACHQTLELPAAAIAKLPSDDIPIPQFLCLKLPIQPYSLNTHPNESWLSFEAPNPSEEICINMLFRHPIPSLELLLVLKKAYGQQWLDGVQSITDPCYNQGKDCLPLWAFELWQSIW